jgi:hypothetical protein
MYNLADQVFGGFDRPSPALGKVVAGIVNRFVIGFRVDESVRLRVNIVEFVRLVRRGAGKLLIYGIANVVGIGTRKIWRGRHPKRTGVPL